MVERFVELIQSSVGKEGRFPLSGLGTFAIAKRAGRTGRNPTTGKKRKITVTNTAKYGGAAPDLKTTAKKFEGGNRLCLRAASTQRAALR
ncbi:MAG TPA: HU family DNA-binding protein [Noviherbaspirillum sp.]